MGSWQVYYCPVLKWPPGTLLPNYRARTGTLLVFMRVVQRAYCRNLKCFVLHVQLKSHYSRSSDLSEQPDLVPCWLALEPEQAHLLVFYEGCAESPLDESERSMLDHRLDHMGPQGPAHITYISDKLSIYMMTHVFGKGL